MQRNYHQEELNKIQKDFILHFILKIILYLIQIALLLKLVCHPIPPSVPFHQLPKGKLIVLPPL
jgi:hypothetical protein